MCVCMHVCGCLCAYVCVCVCIHVWSVYGSRDDVVVRAQVFTLPRDKQLCVYVCVCARSIECLWE